MKTNRQSWLFATRIMVCLVLVLGMSSARADNGTFDTYFTTLPKEEGKGVVTTLCYREEGGEEIYLAFANAPGSAYGKTTWINFSNPWGAEGKLWLECADAANSLYVLAAQGRYLCGVTDNGDGTGVAQTSMTGDRAAAMRFKVVEKETADGTSSYTFVTEDGKWYMLATNNRINNLNFLSTTVVDDEGNAVPREDSGAWHIGTWKGVQFVRLAMRSWESASTAGCDPEDGHYLGIHYLPFAVVMPDGNNYPDGTPVSYMSYGATPGTAWVVEGTSTAGDGWILRALQPGDTVEAGRIILTRKELATVEFLIKPGGAYADMPQQQGALTGYYTEAPLHEAFHFQFLPNYTPRFVPSVITPNEIYGSITYSGYGSSVVAHTDVVGTNPEGYNSICTNIGYIAISEENAGVQEYRIDFDEGLIKRADETGLETLQPEASPTVYYDLMGRPVANSTRGIYIKDGRKVIPK